MSWRTPPAAAEEDVPSLAILLGVNGRAVVQCVGTEQGLPEDCVVEAESPTGLGFGTKAIEIVRRGRLNPATSDGRFVPSRFRVAIPFIVEQPRPAAQGPWRGPAPTPEAMSAGRIVAQQILAVSPQPFLPEIDAPADRQPLIEAWFREETPAPAQTETIIATVLARNFTPEDLQVMAQGRPPSMKTMPDFNAMEKSALDLFDPEAAAAKVRARYCARFECEITSPSPAG